ncbi:MAG: hypothetical protein JJT94_11135 [Bernardetiaceae bacterium]|nr:hypothetical protein [Bernardetiaceae bacterium]
MNKWTSLTLLFLICSSLFHNLSAQLSIGLYPALMIPESAYQRELDIRSAPGIGLRASAPIVYDAFETPILHLYGDFSLYRYGQERNLYNQNFSRLGSSTRYNKAIMDFGLRLAPFVTYKIQPYVEFAIGTNVHYSRSSIDFGTHPDDYDIVTEKSAWGVHYSGGGGVMIPISHHLSLDFRLQYMQGTKVDFLTKGSIEEDSMNPGFAFYDTRRAAPRRFAISIGIIFSFGLDEISEYINEYD